MHKACLRRPLRACAAIIVLGTAPALGFAQGVRGPESRAREGRPSPAPGARDVLDNLVRFDSVFRAGFAVTATERRMDRVDIRGPFFRTTNRWRLTFEGDRTGYLKETTDYETPAYRPPDQRPWANDAHAGQITRGEAMLVSVRMKEWGYWGDEACGNHYEDAAVQVTPDGRGKRVDTLPNSFVYPPRDVSPIAAQNAFHWALGRLFSDRIEKITGVEPTAGDRLRVSATGGRYPGDHGTWELEVEPGAAWMVRSARFRKATRPERVSAEMTNEGTVWSGSFCIPKSARVNHWGPLEDLKAVPQTRTQEIAFEPVVDPFDETLYAQSRQSVLHNTQQKVSVIDARVSPAAMTRPNDPRPAELAPAKTRVSRGWVLGTNVVVVVGLLTALMLRKGWKRAGAGAGVTGGG